MLLSTPTPLSHSNQGGGGERRMRNSGVGTSNRLFNKLSRWFLCMLRSLRSQNTLKWLQFPAQASSFLSPRFRSWQPSPQAMLLPPIFPVDWTRTFLSRLSSKVLTPLSTHWTKLTTLHSCSPKLHSALPRGAPHVTGYPCVCLLQQTENHG